MAQKKLAVLGAPTTWTAQQTFKAPASGVSPVVGKSAADAVLLDLADNGDITLATITAERARIIKRPTSSPGHAPFTWVVQDAVNFAPNIVIDPVTFFGYNSQGAAGALVLGEPVATWNVEADYQGPATGNVRTMEMYAEYRSSDASQSWRPFMSQFKPGAATRETLQGYFTLTGNPIQFIGLKDSGDIEMAKMQPGYFTVSPIAGQDTYLMVQAAATRQSTLQMGANGVDNVFRLITTSTEIYQQIAGAGVGLTLYKTGATTAAAIGLGDNGAGLTVKANSQPNAGIVAEAFNAGQTGNLFVGRDNLGVTKFAISPAGGPGFYGTAPPAKQTLPAAATDAATTQALANAIRTALINYGLAA